jgi:hypothetical protein
MLISWKTEGKRMNREPKTKLTGMVIEEDVDEVVEEKEEAEEREAEEEEDEETEVVEEEEAEEMITSKRRPGQRRQLQEKLGRSARA